MKCSTIDSIVGTERSEVGSKGSERVTFDTSSTSVKSHFTVLANKNLIDLQQFRFTYTFFLTLPFLPETDPTFWKILIYLHGKSDFPKEIVPFLKKVHFT